MGRYKVGDKVRVREWDDMLKECGGNDRTISCACIFVDCMKPLCGKVFTVTEVKNDYSYRLDGEAWSWAFSDDMLYPAITYREYMKENYPDDVSEAYLGGVSNCPDCVGLSGLGKRLGIHCAESVNESRCYRCWDQYMTEAEYKKYVLKEEEKEMDYKVGDIVVENMEGINPILKGSVERYLKKAKYPNLEDVCAILGIGEEEEEAKLDVGDEISFVLKNGTAIRALAVKKETDGMLFCSLNCLPERIAMSESGECDSYEESDVRKYLCENVYPKFPENIKESLVSFENGDFLRIPTEKEIFGKNTFGEEEPESVTQWEPMKRAMYRVAGNADDECTIWYWLKNKSEEYSSTFAYATNSGYANSNGASLTRGVRPVFKIKI